MSLYIYFYFKGEPPFDPLAAAIAFPTAFLIVCVCVCGGVIILCIDKLYSRHKRRSLARDAISEHARNRMELRARARTAATTLLAASHNSSGTAQQTSNPNRVAQPGQLEENEQEGELTTSAPPSYLAVQGNKSDVSPPPPYPGP